MSLHELIENKMFEEAIEAINGGADVNEKEKYRGTTLITAAAGAGRLDIILLLISKGLSSNQGDKEDARIWSAAVSSGNLETVEFFLENGDRDIHHGLRVAASDANIELIKYFVEQKGADVNFSEPMIVQGMTSIATVREQPLSAVCMGSCYGNYELDRPLDDPDILERVIASIKYLLEKGAEINAHGRFGNTALHCAATDSHIKIAEYLLENGANKNAKNDDGKTPLQYAEKKHTAVKALIKAFK